MLTPTTNQAKSHDLSWSDELSTGHDMIDADHRHIFDLANRLQMELQEAEELDLPEYSIVGEVLVELIEHTGGHFEREEVLMQAIGYPRYEEHKLEHDLLMQRVNRLHRQFMDGHNNMALEVSEFLRKWLVGHIYKSDRELARTVRGQK